MPDGCILREAVLTGAISITPDDIDSYIFHSVNLHRVPGTSTDLAVSLGPNVSYAGNYASTGRYLHFSVNNDGYGGSGFSRLSRIVIRGNGEPPRMSP